MLLIKKKDIFQELATTLFLIKEITTHPQASTFMPRLRERAAIALEAALPYTGIFGEKQIRAFLEEKPRKFNIDCGTDIIAGDTIRFIEMVIDNRKTPAKILGKRGITADVIEVHPPSDNPVLLLRVIASGGVWDLHPGDDIRRTMKSIIQLGISRCLWDDENKRHLAKTKSIAILEEVSLVKERSNTVRDIAPTVLGRFDKLRSEHF